MNAQEREAVAADLARLVECEVSEADAALTAASGDYGGIVVKRPRIVVRPQSADEVARVVTYAYQHDLPISARAGGYSFAGQALNDGGVVLDLRRLDAIGPVNPADSWFEAEAGALWGQVVRETLPHRLLPMVLTSYLRTSVGGTLSAGGVGFTSFRHGTQVDHCLELEMVLWSGEVVRCSDDENRDLFQCALGGFGQFGIITRARQRLRTAAPWVRTYFLQYDDLGAHLEDQALIVREGRVHYIDGMLRSCYHGLRVAGERRVGLYSFLYPLNVTVEMSSTGEISDEEMLAELHFSKWVHVEDLSTLDFLLLGHMDEQSFSPAVAEIFDTVYVPWSQAETFLRKVEAHVFPRIAHVEHVGLWPLASHTITRPLFKVPQEPLVTGVGLYCRVPKSYAADTLAVSQGYVDLAMSMGGTYYLTGSVRFDAKRFARQFGDGWPRVREAKRRFDPKGLFNPGFFVWADGEGVV